MIKIIENDNIKQGDALLIIEASTSKLKAGDNYVLEGVFTEFGVKNRNGRIYEESEFLKHVDLLKEAMTSGRRILGELDHPKQFETSLKNVSHVIEDLSYDKTSRTIQGKIRLLNTDAGKQAKALVDAGVPLHISSRAAGTVAEDNLVKITKLFTWDLVDEPGFEKARLNNVNESLGLDPLDTMQIYKIIKETKNTNNEMPDEFVKVDEYNQYSKDILSKITDLQEKFNNINDSITTNNSTEDVITIKEELEEFKNTFIPFVEQIAEGHNKAFGYLNYVAEKFDKSVSHADLLSENVQDIANYLDHLTENVNLRFTHNDHIVENMNKITSYLDYMNKETNKKFTETSKVEERLNKITSYVTYLGENLQVLTDSKLTAISESKVNEAFNFEENDEAYENSLTAKIDKLIESSKKKEEDEEEDEKVDEKTKKKVNENLHFLNFLSKEHKSNFKSLEISEKNKLIEEFKNKDYITEAEVLERWDKALTTHNFLKDAPAKYKKLWENLKSDQRVTVVAQSEYYDFNDVTKIEEFWSTIERQYMGKGLIKENFDPVKNKEEVFEGLSEESFNFYAETLKQHFSK
jgi:hypothetical protein